MPSEEMTLSRREFLAGAAALAAAPALPAGQAKNPIPRWRSSRRCRAAQRPRTYGSQR